VNATSRVVSTVAGNGDGGTSGDGGLATNAEIRPEGIALDAAGNLYISDSTEVREIMAGTGLISKVAGLGYAGFSGDGGSATVAEVSAPQGISFDAAGRLYIADMGNSRVRRVTFFK
jgi:sugar lactone lactonase YvrE